jgi:hypothetical protein
MASPTKQELFDQVAAIISTKRGEMPKPLRPDDFEEALRVFIEPFASEVWNDRRYRPMLTKPGGYSVTFVSGEADLEQAGLEDLLIPTLPNATLTMSDFYEEPFDYVHNYADLHVQGMPGLVRYYVDGLKIVATDPISGLGVVDGVAALRGAGSLDARLASGLAGYIAAKLMARPSSAADRGQQ